MSAMLQQPAFSSVKTTQEALQATQSKPQQQKEIDNQLTQINQTIASLVDGLGKN